MSDVKWIKLAADLFDNDKILLIESMPEGDAAVLLWIKLLCLAGKQNNSGVFRMTNGMAYTDKMFAVIFREKEAKVRAAFDTFEQFGMIETVDGVVTIPGWNEHQSLEALEKRRARDRAYHKKRYDEKKAQAAGKPEITEQVLTENLTENKRDSDDIPTDISTENLPRNKRDFDDISTDVSSDIASLDKNREDKKREYIKKEGKKEAPRFYPPKLEEVADYCLQRGNGIDPQHFIDHYEAVGWMVGKSQMKDWRASVRNWERMHFDSGQSGSAPQRPQIQHRTQPDMDWDGFDD